MIDPTKENELKSYYKVSKDFNIFDGGILPLIDDDKKELEIEDSDNILNRNTQHKQAKSQKSKNKTKKEIEKEKKINKY